MKVFSQTRYIILVCIVIILTLVGTLVLDPGEVKRGGRYVAVGTGSASNAWSDDGKSWTEGFDGSGSDPFGTGTASEARKHKGLWVISGQPSTGTVRKIWWSEDAKNWTAGSGDTFGTTSGSSGKDVEYFRDKWLVGGDPNTASSVHKKISYSIDGKMWNYVNGNPFGSNAAATCLWIKAGGNMVVASGIGSTNIYYSYNGIDWNEGSGNPFGNSLSSSPLHVQYFNGVWLAIGTNGSTASEFLWRSTDGINWSLPTTAPTANSSGGFDVGYFNGVWVATTYRPSSGTTGGIWWSEDEGVNWTVATVDVSMAGIDVKDLIPPTKKGGLWVTGGENTSNEWITFTSPDGKTWTSNTTFGGTDGVATRYISGVYAKSSNSQDDIGDRVVIGGVGSSTEVLYYSDDATTWTAATTQPFGVSGTVQGVVWGRD